MAVDEVDQDVHVQFGDSRSKRCSVMSSIHNKVSKLLTLLWTNDIRTTDGAQGEMPFSVSPINAALEFFLFP